MCTQQKCQDFIDEVDQIKRLSYSTIKKEDFAFEHNGKISKYWTLNKNMVTEGEDDSLEAIDCTFIDQDNQNVTLQFKVYSDLYGNWRVQMISMTFFRPLSRLLSCTTAIGRSSNHQSRRTQLLQKLCRSQKKS